MIKRPLYLSFQLFSIIKQFISRRFTTAGLMVLGGLVVTAAVGFDTKQTMAYQTFTLLLSILVFSLVWGFFFRVRFTVQRKLPKFGTVGEPLTYRIKVGNMTSKKQEGLTLMENPEDIIPTFEEFMHTTEPDEETRNPFDKAIGYHRWMWLLLKKQVTNIEEQAIPTLPPYGEGEILCKTAPAQRGYLRLTGTTIASPDPFNIFKSFITIPNHQSIVVLPKRYPLPDISIPGTRRYQPGGVTMASSVGDSEEFHSLRDYVPGDPLRRIHWKSWAKTGKPIVKEYQDEFFVRHALILDTFLMAEYSEIFEEAVSVAASFICSIQTHESLLDLMFVGAETYCFTLGRGLATVDRMLEILATVRLCRDKPFSALFHSVIERASLLSGTICIFLTWDEERKNLIGLLKSLRVPVLVLIISDRKAPSQLDPGPMKGDPKNFHILQVGKIKEGLAQL